MAALSTVLCVACSLPPYWHLRSLTHCPQDKLSQWVVSASPLCQNGGVNITVDKDSWDHCKRKDLLEACVLECSGVYFYYPELCVVEHAGLTLALLWGALVGLLSLMYGAYFVVRIKLSKYDPSDNSRFSWLMNKAKQGWAHVLECKPWGVKVAALFALATFWYDKASDVKVLSEVWGHTWTGFALLVFLLYQYVLQGYILVLHLIRIHKFRSMFEARLVMVLQKPMYFAFMLCPVTAVLMMIGLDVALFVSDLGLPVPFIDRHFDLEEYQLFRDIGRGLFGTVPTAVLQSVTFTSGATPSNGLVLTTQTFVSAIVASGLQLLKVVGELIYLALKGKHGMHTMFWRLLTGKYVVREEPQPSDLLPQAQVVPTQPSLLSHILVQHYLVWNLLSNWPVIGGIRKRFSALTLYLTMKYPYPPLT